MSHWTEKELASTQMDDERLRKRLKKLTETLSQSPKRSIPLSCPGWSDTVAAYRFLDNESVSLEKILSGHQKSTLERMNNEKVVLVLQDTTFMSYQSEKQVRDYGTLKKIESEHYLWHVGIAITPEKINLGVLHAKPWQRPEIPIAHLRNKKPIEDKESYRWLEGYEIACQAQEAAKSSLIINIADREGDIHEWFALAASQPIERRAEYMIRAKCNRRIEQEDQDEYSYIWEELNNCVPFGSMQIQTPRRPNMPSRKATLAIKAKEITLVGRQGKTRKPLTLHAVYAKETHPPKGKKGIEWMLLTSLPVENLNAAQTIIGWYGCRWEIELYFRVLKQECKVEELRLQTDQRLENAIAVYLIVAWRIHNITMISREHGDESCEIIYEKKEWQTIYMMHQKKKPPKEPPALQEMTRMLAQLGGFLARKHDGQPGAKTLWLGYQKLIHYMDALEIVARV